MIPNYPKWKIWKQRRYMVAFLAFFGFFNIYTIRSSLSIALAAMTENKTTIVDSDAVLSQPAEFNWDSKIQGYILSSFFYGYISTQLFGGWISARIGGKRLFGGGVAGTAVLALLTPWLTTVSVNLLLAVRVIQGVVEGVTYPCIHAVWARWAPPLERTRLATIAFSGSYVGTVVSLPLSAYLAKTLRWPSIFYFFGALALLWVAVWWWSVAESPAQDSRISRAELQYITEQIGTTRTKTTSHPWKKLLTSMPVWAIVAAHFSDCWGFYTLLTELPKFMQDILDFDLGQAGFMSALPYLVMAIIVQFSGQLADWLRKKHIFTTTQVRKIFCCGGLFFRGAFLLGAALWLQPVGSVFCITMAAGLGVITWSGFGANYLDIAPQHASVIMGISNTVGTMAGICSPILTGYIVVTPTAAEWQVVFFVSCGICFFGLVVFGLFSSGELQPWAIVTEEDQEGPKRENSQEDKI